VNEVWSFSGEDDLIEDKCLFDGKRVMAAASRRSKHWRAVSV